LHRVVLTFDDGPDIDHTPRILDQLAKANVQAVFFILGMRIETPRHMDLVRRAAAEGHLIGNHTFNHSRLTELSADAIRADLLKNQELIAEFEPRQKLFRPPFGSCNETVNSVARELGYRTVLWNVDSTDWKDENKPAGWVDVAMKQIKERPRSVCLFHDYGHTADHLSQLLERVNELPDSQFVRYDQRRDFKYILSRLWQKSGLQRA
jgi:peptidoglycan-N-acetylglucosamine deacetylase